MIFFNKLAKLLVQFIDISSISFRHLSQHSADIEKSLLIMDALSVPLNMTF